MGDAGQAGALGPGSELDGFVIEAVAGRGGMGVVYRARQRQPDRIVALKVIAVELADAGEFRARFKRESTIAAQIEHPHVIPVYAVGEAGGVLYLAMRFVDGVDLRALLTEEGRLGPARAARIVGQVAAALDAAHRRGLVHRDVKPANILVSNVDGQDHVYLSDFGLSRHVEGSSGVTGTGAFLGTIDYVAPEQARGDRVDARTDVYALGCVLFHVLTGTVPYPLGNDLAKLYAHDAQPPPSALERAPDLPTAFEPVISRAMAKSPDDRYPSAGDLGRAAAAAAEGARAAGTEQSVAVGAAAAAPPTAVAGPEVPGGAEVPAPTGRVPAPAVGGPAPAAPGAGDAVGWSPRSGRGGRRGVIAVAALVAAVAVAAIVVGLGGGGGGGSGGTGAGGSGAAGGGGSSPVTVITENPSPAVVLPAVVGLHDYAAHEVAAPGGYHYRLLLSFVAPPPGASVATPVAYYFTLSVRRGNQAYVVVHRRRVPYPFTATSSIANFGLSSNPDGTANAALSWYVRKDDANDVTHYFTLTPNRINVD